MTGGQRTKKLSKRFTLAHKYKVQKKVRDHQRKLKKAKKKNPGKYSNKRKDPGIPNSVPFKAAIILEAQVAKAAAEERREMQRMELKLRRKEDRGNLHDANRNISDIMEDAQKRASEFDSLNGDSTDKKTFTDKSAKAYYREFKKVIESADVILEVLDARDPQGTRCLVIEDAIRNDSKKRLVLVLNKADLVPRASLEAWLKYLRREYPTVLFKASTQNQAKNLSHAKTKPLKGVDTLQTSRCIGADTIMQLLKNYCRNCGIKTAISVGVVGLPNVGKSSLINSLKRTKACNVGATPGVTRTLQEVTLDSKVQLIDCPGVILPGVNASDDGSCLRNAFKVESLEDAIPPVQEIFDRVGKEQLKQHYSLPPFNDSMEFLSVLAKRRGKLGKNGTPLVQVAAKAVIRDWNVGRIKYYTTPPESRDLTTKSDAVLVEKMSQEFSMDDLVSKEGSELSALPDVASRGTVRVNSLKPVQALHEEAAEEPMAVDHKKEKKQSSQSVLPQNVEIDMALQLKADDVPLERKPRWETQAKTIDLSKTSLKKLQKQQSKKLRKEMGRNERRADELTDAFNAFEGIGGSGESDEEPQKDDYDFKDYYAKQ